MDGGFCPRKCFRCSHFCVSSRDEKIHNFLDHHQQVGALPVELKPMSKIRYDDTLQKYFVTFDNHGKI